MRYVPRELEIYFFRDEQGLEVDFLAPGRGGSISLVECKASRTVKPAMAVPLQRLAEALKKKRPQGVTVNLSLVHQSPRIRLPTEAVAPGVRAMPWQDFVGEL